MIKHYKHPKGWDEARVKRVLEHYEAQSEEEAVAEDEAVVRNSKENASLKNAENSFQQGLKEAMNGETMPLDELWTDTENDAPVV